MQDVRITTRDPNSGSNALGGLVPPERPICLEDFARRAHVRSRRIYPPVNGLFLLPPGGERGDAASAAGRKQGGERFVPGNKFPGYGRAPCGRKLTPRRLSASRVHKSQTNRWSCNKIGTLAGIAMDCGEFLRDNPAGRHRRQEVHKSRQRGATIAKSRSYLATVGLAPAGRSLVSYKTRLLQEPRSAASSRAKPGCSRRNERVGARL